MKDKLCFICHKAGHQAFNCPTKPKGKKRPQRKPGRRVRQIIQDQDSSEAEEAEEASGEESVSEELNVEAVQADFDNTDF